jgi:hypothetical protein
MRRRSLSMPCQLDISSQCVTPRRFSLPPSLTAIALRLAASTCRFLRVLAHTSAELSLPYRGERVWSHSRRSDRSKDRRRRLALVFMVELGLLAQWVPLVARSPSAATRVVRPIGVYGASTAALLASVVTNSAGLCQVQEPCSASACRKVALGCRRWCYQAYKNVELDLHLLLDVGLTY